MSVYLVARSMHILAMVLTLTLIMATEPLFVSAARAQDIKHLAQCYRLTQRLQQFSQLTTLVGLVAGVVLVVLAGWNPFAPWLLVTYSLLVVMSIIGRIGMVVLATFVIPYGMENASEAMESPLELPTRFVFASEFTAQLRQDRSMWSQS